MSVVPDTAAVCDVDFYSNATIADPVAAYEKMLSIGSVVWLEPNSIYAVCGHRLSLIHI